MENNKILIIDDHATNLNVIISMIEKSHPDYLIYQALGGNKGLELAKKIVPDIIITDWDMPGMDGLELINKLKAEETTKDIPVIMSTGVMLSSTSLEKALAAGAVDYIRKPIDGVELIARIHSALTIAQYHKTIVETKNRELAENTLYLIQSNKFNIQITKKLQNVYDSLDDDNSKAEINKVIQDIDARIRMDSWQRFDITFQSVHSNFTKTLLEKFPDLTPAEIKLCTFLKLGMNTKDIASLLYQSPDSVKVSRSRLRKKIGLDSKESLQNFLSVI
ncbi:MAG: response regulator [Bacteroidales bacterium]|jgi:CheY-like chemotaxis protein/DNA-binding CsgD family transcriptional regulator|nr:response regulator [Bacteroidales bacterium]